MQKYIDQAKQSLLTQTLYVLATPIGNLSDITLRALAVLEKADLICAEDTRVSAQLLSAYGLKGKLISVREHNEAQMVQQVIQALQENKIVVQLSDAGTPAICDPGARLVKGVRDAGFSVSPIVGASALVGALSVAGMNDAQFFFAGFLPPKSKERQTVLQSWLKASYTVVAFETPHRIEATLEDMVTVFGTRRVVLARELTKTFETILDGDVAQLLEQVKNDRNQSRGEFVLLIEGVKAEKQTDLTIEAQNMAMVLAKHLPTKQAAELTSELSGVNKKIAYDFIVQSKNSERGVE
ncbi:16S rRNA (cytidine(1402)-2'-O)-methyltransferase [Neisseria sp. Ec49-e6-T10]|uniref:16S rRNA (cytidine(1402)-2'-O)-methyltransferase n=1 Tax=Neisseria sp. Ec49-e6-T10 TaxID=3140744 RepID=UPI003EBDD81B